MMACAKCDALAAEDFCKIVWVGAIESEGKAAVDDWRFAIDDLRFVICAKDVELRDQS